MKNSFRHVDILFWKNKTININNMINNMINKNVIDNLIS